MRPLLFHFLTRHGLPGWLAPTYLTLVVLATWLGSALVLRQAQRDGEDLRFEARSHALVYIGALLGGYALEVLRALPAAVRAGSLAPCLHVGRAAYGGLIFSCLLVVCYRISRRLSVAAFLDRSVLAAGVSYFAVRIGCFLSGCDYGIPTASRLGVRFPAGSLAAVDHAARGYVPAGLPSLPVHPTELYEAALAGGAAILAARRLRRPKRDGNTFLLWLALYASGRFFIEFLRGDETRGLYLGLSSAQLISLALCGLVAVCVVAQRPLTSRSLMNPVLRFGIAGLVLLTGVSAAAARTRRSDAAPTAVLQLPDGGTAVATQPEPSPAGSAAYVPPPAPPPPLPGSMSPPSPYAPQAEFMLTRPPVASRKYWELSAIGGGVLAGVYVLSLLTGVTSYGAFYKGQWGWFIPLVGPMVTMGNAGNQVCTCFTNQLYTYSIGTVLTLATLGAMVPTILGGVLTKPVAAGRISKLQLVPTFAPSSTGLQLVGRF